MRSGFFVCLVLCAFTFGASAAPFGDASRGRKLAEAWCVTCHLIDAGEQRSTQSGVPPFPTVAKNLKNKGQRERLEKWLANPHGPMSSLKLSGQDIADLLTYIETLVEPDK